MMKLKVTNGQVGAGVPFERIRRITGYLSGDVSRFNAAKQAEVRDRVKHTAAEKEQQPCDSPTL